jgi:hypothetical protein
MEMKDTKLGLSVKHGPWTSSVSLDISMYVDLHNWLDKYKSSPTFVQIFKIASVKNYWYTLSLKHNYSAMLWWKSWSKT